MRTPLIALSAIVASVIAPHAQAQVQAQAPVPAQTKAEEITVTTTRRTSATAWSAAETPGAVDSVNAANIRNGQPLVNLSESLVRVPGLTANNRQNQAQDLQISVRGFGARASFGIRGVRLLVDELPATFPDGQAQGAVVPLTTLERIEVLRGPWAVAYGNAAGGVIHAFSAPAGTQPGLRADVMAGPYAQTRVSVAGEWSGAEADAASRWQGLRSELTRYRAQGFRRHSAVVRDQWSTRADWTPAPGQQLSLHANALDQPETEDPLGLTAQQFADDPRQAGTGAATFNTRKSVRQRQAGAVWRGGEAGWSWTAVLHGGARSVRQFLSTPVAAQTPAGSSGGVVDLARDFAGLSLRAGQEAATHFWQAGIDWDRSDEARKGFENFDATGRLGVIGRLRRDESTVVTGRDVFAQAGVLQSLAQGESLRWLAGVRSASVRFATTDRFIAPGNGDDSGELAYRATTGSVGLSWTAAPGVHLHASVGRGFETPTTVELAYRTDGASGFNGSLRASTSRQAEAGIKWRGAAAEGRAAARAEATVFHILTQDEIVPASNSGGRTTFQNGGRTARRGIELSLRWPLARDWSVEGNASWIDARFREGYRNSNGAGSALVVRDIAAGNALPGIPVQTIFASLGHRLDQPGYSWAVDITRRGDVWADDRNSTRVAGATVLALRFMHRMRVQGYEVESWLRIDNLGDRRYAGSVIVNETNERYFESAPGRGVMAGVRVRF